MSIIVVNKSISATKRGPGRVHGQGAKKSRPVAAEGASVGFVQHYSAPERAKARKMGRRERRAFEIQLRAHGYVGITYGSPRQRIREALSTY